jgi:hypothetical protein
MADQPEFGRRRRASLPDLPATPEPKRSCHVSLLLMGTFFVGAGAFVLMARVERQNCYPSPPAAPGMAAPAPPQGACTKDNSWFDGHSSGVHGRYNLFGGNSSGGSTSGSEASSGISRGGFGGFAHAFGFGGS